MAGLHRVLPVLAVVLMVFAGTMAVPLAFAWFGHDAALVDHVQALAITFIFTRCPFPTFCPLMSRNFEEVQKKLLER